MHKHNRDDAGFSLLELIVVGAIIAALFTAMGVIFHYNIKAQAHADQDFAQRLSAKYDADITQTRKSWSGGHGTFNINGDLFECAYSGYDPDKGEPLALTCDNLGAPTPANLDRYYAHHDDQ